MSSGSDCPRTATAVEDMRRYWAGTWAISDDGRTAMRVLPSGAEVTMSAPCPESLDIALYITQGD